MNLEAKFIICPLCLPLEQPKSPAAHSVALVSVPSQQSHLHLSLWLCAEQAAQEQQDHLAQGSTVTCSSGHFHTTEPKITVMFSERNFLSVLLWTQAQLAHQMDMRVGEQAHEEAEGDQVGQRSVDVLQMQCQDT